MSDYEKEQLRLCADSFSYFVTNFVKIIHPKKGYVPLLMHSYQERLIKAYEKNRFTILTKFRQGGFSTITAVWALWKCMFEKGKSIMWLSGTDAEAIMTNNMVRQIIKNLPEWLIPELSKNNDHQIFFTNTGSSFRFHHPVASRGIALDLLIIDEAAYIKKMETHWKAMYPTLSCGGNLIVISTPNGLGNWFQETYQNAMEGKNTFHVFESSYTEHPDYSNPDWVKEMRANLGERGWHQEVLQSFLAELEPDDGKC